MATNLAWFQLQYPLALIRLFAATRKQWMNTRWKIQGLDKRVKDRIRNLVVQPFMYRCKASLWLWYIASSELFEVLFQVSWFSLGRSWVHEDRKRGHDLMTLQEVGTEDKLGLGQLLPILLLALPVMSILETSHLLQTPRRDWTKKRRSINSSSAACPDYSTLTA
ncbi:hypothetical protein VTL71DRAFT_10600 [Oculimacula yallundae]|uniref:Uncharacterized protein n=1 Tax=Oculimacula yallundae TaxID=86028 RepID=A0ABR4CVS9_9HELO